jgi:hypothetical protein
MGDDRGVAAIRPRHHPDDVTSAAKSRQRPMPGIAGVVPRPTHASWIIHRPIPAASWIIHRTFSARRRPHDPAIPAAS